MDLVSFFLSEVVSSFAHEKLSPMPVEDGS
jgi:hypothetical protein